MKGRSNNPGGMTSAAIQRRRMLADTIAAATDGGKEIIDFVVAVLRGQDDVCEDATSKRWAADFLADRLWGKAQQHVDLSSRDEAVQIPDMRGKSLEELRQIAAGAGVTGPAEPSGDSSGNVH